MSELFLKIIWVRVNTLFEVGLYTVRVNTLFEVGLYTVGVKEHTCFQLLEIILFYVHWACS